MGLSFKSKVKNNEVNKDSTPTSQDSAEGSIGTTKTTKHNFLKKGDSAKEAVAKAAVEAEMRANAAGSLWTYWMPIGEERVITFLDGDLDEEGMLDITMYHQHTVKLNGRWTSFPCTSDEEPCPICEQGGNRATLVGLLTVMDHTPTTIKSGKNAGKVVKNQKKLFVCKQETMARLTKKAKKHGGSLAGCQFDVSRSDSKGAPNVGDDFDFIKKFDSFEDIADVCDKSMEDILPADYVSEIKYYTAAELLELGVGKASPGIGSEDIDTYGLKDEL